MSAVILDWREHPSANHYDVCEFVFDVSGISCKHCKPDQVATDESRETAAYLKVLRDYFAGIRMRVVVDGKNYRYDALIWRRTTLAGIIHKCASRVPPNWEMRGVVLFNCELLGIVCDAITTEIANPEADPLFLKIAKMSCDELFKQYGLFDPHESDCRHLYKREKQLWTHLVARVHALNEVINSRKLDETDIKRLRALSHRCTMVALVIEYHLLVYVIDYDAFTHDDPYPERIDGACACPDGISCGSAKWIASHPIATKWKNFSTDFILNSVDAFIKILFAHHCVCKKSQVLRAMFG